jgi:2-oxoglutarate dehydrogenase E1 component
MAPHLALVGERSTLRSESALAATMNPGLVESLHDRWAEDPDSVSRDWQLFFAGFELATCPRTCVAATQANAQSRVASLIFAYRNQGHLIAELDPLKDDRTTHPALALDAFGFGESDLDRVFDTGHLAGPPRATLREIVGALAETYCRSMGVEYLHMQDRDVRRWLQSRMEGVRNHPPLVRDKQLFILESLIDAELFEAFLNSRYPGQKRFSLEGAESVIPALLGALELAPSCGIQEVVLSMAHRGRLNVLANVLHKSYAMIFSEFEDIAEPETYGGDADVKYHRGYTGQHRTASGRQVHVSLTANPSHLEAVNPVTLGRVRAKQRQANDAERRAVIPLLIHGDAAFAGQGLVAETLNLSQVHGYRVGGTIHFIVNNQIGFTTTPREGRSSAYASDVAKMVEAPVFHVNGDDPEAVVWATELALQFRQEFRRDVVVDMVCYRRHGHSEGDEPAFTQPLLYRKIQERPSVRRLYTRELAARGVITADEEHAIADRFRARLETALAEARAREVVPEVQAFSGLWRGFRNPYSHEPAPTAVAHQVLLEVARAVTTLPDGFELNPKVARRLPEVRRAVEERGSIDWATAELLAFGSLLHEGCSVRLSGQDSTRGTFSQRHAVWHDMKSQLTYVPLANIRPEQGKFRVYNSALSEAAVLGFDYGCSLADPRMLVVWEAQFGDFSNGAQVIIDQFIVSSQHKWQRSSGLVMLLPHGMEGQGPEHSNAYLERYLAACAENNLQVVNLSTPAQYFHALRRQLKRPFRLPLVVMAPKSLLRHPACTSPVRDLEQGRFREVIDDPEPRDATVRLVLTSGKLYHELAEQRARHDPRGVALVRLEQFYPWHEDRMREIAERYREVPAVVWAQEESQNRGGWSFVFPRLVELFPGKTIHYAGRPPSSSPATGSLRIHQREQEQLIRSALGLEA